MIVIITVEVTSLPLSHNPHHCGHLIKIKLCTLVPQAVLRCHLSYQYVIYMKQKILIHRWKLGGVKRPASFEDVFFSLMPCMVGGKTWQKEQKTRESEPTPSVTTVYC